MLKKACNKKTKRIILSAISLFIVVFILSSLVYVAFEKEHRCVHKNCEPCRLMQLCTYILNKLVFFVAILLNTAYLLNVLHFKLKVADLYLSSISPVSLKVKLLN